jgi:hypothetical protein
MTDPGAVTIAEQSEAVGMAASALMDHRKKRPRSGWEAQHARLEAALVTLRKVQSGELVPKPKRDTTAQDAATEQYWRDKQGDEYGSY